MGRSFDSLVSYTGSRHEQDTAIQELCDRADELKCRDLASIAIAISKERADLVAIGDAIKRSGIHMSSEIDQRVFHKIDGFLYDVFDDIAFVELSPVQPFGLNTALAGLSESKILATTRKSEVNADVSTALVREALVRDINLSDTGMRLAANTRITRAQKFDPETKFLPHFRMFGQVTVGRNDDPRTAEIANLSHHLSNEVKFLEKLRTSNIGSLTSISVELGDVRIIDRLIKNGIVDIGSIKRNTANPSFDVFEANNIALSKSIELTDPALKTILLGLELPDVYDDVIKLYEALTASHPDIGVNSELKLNRIAGHNYYQGTCYNILGTNAEGLTLPLADGGYTDWAKRATTNNKAYSVSSGIGTELLARYFTRAS